MQSDKSALYDKTSEKDSVEYEESFRNHGKPSCKRKCSKAVNEMKIVSAIEDKPIGLIVSCQGPVEYNTELIQMLFDKSCESSLAKCMGKYIFPFCDADADHSHYDETTLGKIWMDILEQDC